MVSEERNLAFDEQARIRPQLLRCGQAGIDLSPSMWPRSEEQSFPTSRASEAADRKLAAWRKVRTMATVYGKVNPSEGGRRAPVEQLLARRPAQQQQECETQAQAGRAEIQQKTAWQSRMEQAMRYQLLQQIVTFKADDKSIDIKFGKSFPSRLLQFMSKEEKRNLSQSSSGIAAVLRDAATLRESIDEEKAEMEVFHFGNFSVDLLGARIHYELVMLTKGSAVKITQKVKQSENFEAHRLLSKRWSRHSIVSLLEQALEASRGKPQSLGEECKRSIGRCWVCGKTGACVCTECGHCYCQFCSRWHNCHGDAWGDEDEDDGSMKDKDKIEVEEELAETIVKSSLVLKAPKNSKGDFLLPKNVERKTYLEVKSTIEYYIIEWDVVVLHGSQDFTSVTSSSQKTSDDNSEVTLVQLSQLTPPGGDWVEQRPCMLCSRSVLHRWTCMCGREVCTRCTLVDGRCLHCHWSDRPDDDGDQDRDEEGKGDRGASKRKSKDDKSRSKRKSDKGQKNRKIATGKVAGFKEEDKIRSGMATEIKNAEKEKMEERKMAAGTGAGQS